MWKLKSRFYIPPLLICASWRDVLFLVENGWRHTKCSTFRPFSFLCLSCTPACHLPVALLPSIRGGWAKGGDEEGKGRDAARGALPVPVASPLPPELSLQHLRASGRLARRLADVLLIREMLEQNTRCEQLLNAVCPELAGQAVTLVLWSVCLFIFSLFTDLVSRSRLRVLAVLKFC